MKSLEEINTLLRADPMFYRFYLMRVNYYSRRSKNPDIRLCEITHMVNKGKKVVVSEARQLYEQIQRIIENDEKTVDGKMIAADLEKVFELTKIFDDFMSKLPKTDLQAARESNPRNCLEFFARAFHIALNFQTTVGYSQREVNDDYEMVLELSPNFYPATVNLVIGKLNMMRKGIYNTSYNQSQLTVLSEINQVIELVPNFVIGISTRSELHSILGDSERAITDVDKCLTFLKEIPGDKYNKEIARFYCNKGVYCSRIGDDKQMLSCYNLAIDANPENYLSFNNLGHYYKRIGDNKRAMNNFTSALKINPNYGDCLCGRGELYFLNEEYELAIKDFTANLKLSNPIDKGWTLQDRGKAFLEIEMFEKAILDFTESITLDIPESIDLRNTTVEKLKEKIMRK